MITSVKNEMVKEWRKLKQKKERDRQEKFMIEGFHLIEEAHKSEWEIVALIHEEHIEIEKSLLQYPLYTVSDNVMAAITETKTPQGIAAVVKKRNVQDSLSNKALLIDEVQDPGNVGTMIRTADAAGFDTVILGKGTVDLYNDKVIRATQGSIFHLNIMQADLIKEMEKLQANGIPIWSTGLAQAKPYQQVEKPDRIAIVVGNEGAGGVSKEIMDKASENVVIPIHGKAESLNVSVAAAILMYYVVG